jgi:MFS family permease
LSGLSFAIFYVVLGIPIAKLADRSNRRNIIAGAIVVWSAMTALCGLAQNYTQLLLARVGVGVGEAGCSPPAHAMISDYFSENQRATALSLYSMGIYFGILFGFSLGGWLDSEYGWRIAFLALGIPGILLALIFLLTVKEPTRKQSPVAQNSPQSIPAMLRYLFAKPCFVYLAFAVGLHTVGTYGLGNWMPSFLKRVHGMSQTDIGLYGGLIIGIGGALGTFIGGYLADKLGRKDKSWYLKISAISGTMALPFLMGYYFFDSVSWVLASLFVGYALISAFLAPSIAITHSLVPENMRAFSSSVLFLTLNLIGLGLGPLIVGILSDLFQPSLAEQSLRWALACTVFTSLIAIFLFYKASQTVEDAIES